MARYRRRGYRLHLVVRYQWQGRRKPLARTYASSVASLSAWDQGEVAKFVDFLALVTIMPDHEAYSEAYKIPTRQELARWESEGGRCVCQD